MEKKKYTSLIQEAKTFDELESLKQGFLQECSAQYNRIAVANTLSKITNFGDAKAMFESTLPSLMKVKGGKTLINKFAKTIKENKSLKTLYAYHEGLKDNVNVDAKKNYITEALAISEPVNTNEYETGLSKIVNLVTESFKLIGVDAVLANVKHDEKAQMLGESLVYLASTKKNIRNLNEYISHLNRVSDNLVENTVPTINTNSTLEEIVAEMKGSLTTTSLDSIFESENKAQAFNDAKTVCLEMISAQKEYVNDDELRAKLNEMENKLNKKVYNYDTYTKDMLYMTELQEVLK